MSPAAAFPYPTFPVVQPPQKNVAPPAAKVQKVQPSCADSTPVTQTTPNFAKIYSFFANMFDPQVSFDATAGVRQSGMSPLDKEVIKLLMSNLEFNIANTAFRQQLLETYRQQLQQSVPTAV